MPLLILPVDRQNPAAVSILWRGFCSRMKTYFWVSAHLSVISQIELAVFNSSNIIGVTGGSLNGFYQFDSAHLHWGKSEHELSSKEGVAELHLIHKNIRTDKYPEELAVLGIVYEMGGDSKEMEKLIKAFDASQDEDSFISKVMLADLVPEAGNDFYRYRGSLTTPGCDENVLWTVFRKTRTISRRQLKWLQSISLGKNVSIENNWRGIQQQNDPIVMFYSPSSAATLNTFTPLIILITVAVSLKTFSYS